MNSQLFVIGQRLEPNFKSSHFIIGNIMETKKEKRPTKKGLINEIEKLDTQKQFNLLSLTRTNIDNLVVILDLLKGVK